MPSFRAVCLFTLGLGIIVALGCQRAQRYPMVIKELPSDKAAAKAQAEAKLGWIEGHPSEHDMPIVFVPASHKDEWQELEHFWTNYKVPGPGAPTIFLGLGPLNALSAIIAATEMGPTASSTIVKIKVPAGLDDPTPHIPAANPATYNKWRLGRDLFFDRNWLTDSEPLACASCHDPNHGFTHPEDKSPRPLKVPYKNPPSLINCVYNKSQFWDGRVKDLEQVVQRQLDDEVTPLPSDSKRYHITHSWGGIIGRLKESKYADGFKKVFGIPEPTTDAVAKALATYMRTILSGNSLYDKAKRAADKDGSKKLLAKHFEPYLVGDVFQALKRKAEPEPVAAELARGYELFFSKTCHLCHSGTNFTDNSFHNTSIREAHEVQISGLETGHFHYQPYGLKQASMIGAFKTPTLRHLPRTGPYFHDASATTLDEVVEYYNKGIDPFMADNLYLDKIIEQNTPLHLNAEDIRALAVFLRALDGEAVAPEVSSVTGKK